ncbi:cellulose binding domain-containing protein [Kitasatospora sp. SolWspMP-SS2h]|uniref:cellulose binding domain-containing protein n=1 Tax=Kitasatospora sp. SolWspMP-SS2h TaxID=1305729 RepID=UPI000DB9EC09|nr:cellulose binding domain-containing protein [Kitasatospora sp. SolWspMP-SS2h]RAJ44824.1 cellulose binding domain-containing protein [Kitasatospora sp. SolWspMP-SS2h]
MTPVPPERRAASRPPVRGRRPVSAVVAAVAAVAACAATAVLPRPTAGAAEPTGAAAVGSQPYSWNNVQIGGGGFIPGIVFNQGQQGLVYARTDIGGAYRQDPATKQWIPLLDSLGWDDWGLTGVASLATDARDPKRVYVAAGTYTNGWDPANGAILRSSDQGRTWQRTTLPFKVGGNMPGRGMGERLTIDPNNSAVLWFGAPSGKGLWRSADYGVTWSQVKAFPVTGTYAPDPTDTSGYQSDPLGVLWEVFDQGGGTVNGVTRTVYVGVADQQNSVYRSDDGGTTWTRIGGQPTGFVPHKAVLDASGNLFVSYSDTGGPYDGAHGDVWKYATGTGAWTNVSPVPSSNSSDNYFGYSGLTVDRRHPNVLMVTGYSSWWPDTRIWRSTDSGATWKPFWSYDGYPNRVDRYTMDVSAVPWLTFHANASAPEEAPKLGWMTESLEIDPFDSDRMLYGTGATLYGSSNLTDFDKGAKVGIAPVVKGLEETAVNDLVSPPAGAPLLSSLGDLGGFRHDDPAKVPAQTFAQPNLTSGTSMDFAEAAPATMVRVGETASGSTEKHIGYSTDGGSHWFAASAEPAGVTGGGQVALAADGAATVWSPKGTGVYRTSGTGSSWTAATGIPAGASVQADRVDPKTFYGWSGGTFYVSTDAGATFTAKASGLPAASVRFKAVPGTRGDVWLAGGTTATGYGLWHSTDAGATFARQPGVDQADSIGFGKAAPGRTHPAMYTSAKIGGVRGLFRSDDAGASWVRINDDAHQWGWTGGPITGDPRIYGRVYVGTNGRGVLYGDTAGGVSPSPSASASPSPSPSSSPSPSPSASPSASASPSSGTSSCEVAYAVSSQWGGGFGANVTVTNRGTAPVNGWTVAWTFPSGQSVTSLWNGSVAQSGAKVTVTDAGHNRTIAPGSSVSFGFNGSWTTANTAPTAFTLNGAACAVKSG